MTTESAKALTGQTAGQIPEQGASVQAGTIAEIDDSEHVSPIKSFRFEQVGSVSAPIIKKFRLPERLPYDISSTNFSIVSQDTELAQVMERMIAERIAVSATRPRTNADEMRATTPTSQSTASGSTATMSSLSASPVGNYYIYSFDGRLLAEYDIYGACLKDYVYMGNRLVAEYNPTTSQYFYYTQDQIGSTRIVTNDSGAVVYAEAHDPYGGIQKTWPNNTFDPKRKFSDKERDGETGLDYFGARYYSAPVRRADGNVSGIYRWLSVDPMLIKRNDPNPPVHWNLYTFCQNNPISYKDDVGREVAADKTIHIFLGVDLGPQYLDYAKLEELRLKGYKIIIHEVGTWTADDFKASLKGENSWTFYIGHSEGRGENYNGIFIPGQAGLFAGQGLNYTNNERVGIFGCNSANYANDLVYGLGTTIFSLASKGNAKVAGYWTGAYYLIYELAKGASLEDAARRFQEELEGILKPKGWYRGEKLKIR